MGANGGVGFGSSRTDVAPLPSAAIFVNLKPTTLKDSPKGALGGATAGYNWRLEDTWLVGAEADFDLTAINGNSIESPIIQNNGTFFPGAGFLSTNQTVDWLSTLRARLGYNLSNETLLFVTAGGTFAGIRASAITDFRPVGTETYPGDLSRTASGWTVGAGMEFAATDDMSLKVEYLYADLGSRSVLADPVPPLPPFQVGYRGKMTVNLVRVGINFKVDCFD